MRRRSVVAAVAVLVVGVTGACSSDDREAARPASTTASSTTTTTTPTQAEPPEPPELAWTTCPEVGAAVECADLTVPMDYADPDGPTISVALARVPADPDAERIGTLVVNPGGPGVPSLFLAPVLKSIADLDPDEAAVLDRFDIVSFDHRGSGESTAVDCGDTTDLDLVDYSPETTAEMAELTSTMEAFAAACDEHTGPLLAHLSAVDIARDLDQLRRALREEKLNLLGFSYGTELFGTYAELYPDRVRTAVLDSAMPSGLTGVELFAAQATSVERQFQRFLDRCDAAADCPIPGDDAGAAYDRLIEQWDARPPSVAGATGPSASEVATVAGSALLEPAFPTSFARGVAEGLEGDATTLLAAWDDYAGTTNGASPSLVGGIAVVCSTVEWPSADTFFDTAVTEQQTAAPRMGEAFLREYLPCAYWAHEGQPTGLRTATGAPTIVVVGNTNDPVTPYSWSEQLVEELDDAVLLTREGEGHLGWMWSSCIRRAAGSYLVSGTPPEMGTTCPSDL